MIVPTTAPAPTAAIAVSPLLTRLAAERATGALLRDRGTLFLEDGRIVHAESPATPASTCFSPPVVASPPNAGARR